MQIMIGLVVGIVIGWLRPDWGNKVYFLRDIFINLIKSIIAPLVFSTIVVGIAGAGALRKVGRMGVKALIYFEIVTTAALIIGLAVVNFMKPGAGITLAASNTDIVKTIGQSHPKTLVETLVHVFPSSVIDSMVRGDVLQIVAFSVLFALAVSSVGEKGKPIIRAMESLSQIMFKFTNYVMMFAPIGVGAAMAHTVATQGLGVLANLGKLIGSLYLALIIFVALVFGLVMLIARIPVRQFIRAVREPATIAFATTSSESALPKAMEAMERFGVPRSHRWVRDADWIFFQSHWLDTLSGDGFGVRRASGRDNDGLAHGSWSANHDDADIDAHFEGRGGRAAGGAGDFAGDVEYVCSGRTRPDRDRCHLRNRRIDGHGTHLRERNRQLSRYDCGRALGKRIRRQPCANLRNAARGRAGSKIRRCRFR